MTHRTIRCPHGFDVETNWCEECPPRPKRTGWPMRNRRERMARNEDIVERVTSGEAITEVARRYRIHVDTAETVLRNAGISTAGIKR